MQKHYARGISLFKQNKINEAAFELDKIQSTKISPNGIKDLMMKTEAYIFYSMLATPKERKGSEKLIAVVRRILKYIECADKPYDLNRDVVFQKVLDDLFVNENSQKLLKGAFEQGGSIKFTATVTALGFLRKHEGPIVTTHFDSKYFITLEIKDAPPDEGILKEGESQSFAVHSPTNVFHIFAASGTESCIGKNYKFLVNRKETEDGFQWQLLRAIAIK